MRANFVKDLRIARNKPDERQVAEFARLHSDCDVSVLEHLSGLCFWLVATQPTEVGDDDFDDSCGCCY